MIDTLLALLFLGSLAATLVGFGSTFYFQHKLYRYMESAHPKLWKDAGSPKLLYGFLWIGAPMPKFLLHRQYRNLPDTMLRTLGRRAYAATFTSTAAFLAFIVSALAYSSLASNVAGA